MSKRIQAKMAKVEEEKAALNAELYLLAVGAAGTTNIEDDPENGLGICLTVGIEAWSRWLEAVRSYWKIGCTFSDTDGETRLRGEYIFRPYNLPNFEVISKTVEYLYASGVRAGGVWA